MCQGELNLIGELHWTGSSFDEELEKVFETFQRGEKHAPYSGPGLGLPLVKNLVELHGGQVIMTSQMDKGTCVEIILPVRSELVEVGEADNETLDAGEAGDAETISGKAEDERGDVKSAGRA